MIGRLRKSLRAPGLALVALLVAVSAVRAADGGGVFWRDFTDSTLRVDYILAGTPQRPALSVAATSFFPGWSGRHSRLDSYPLAGNLSVIITDRATGDTLYVKGMSSLYSEWLELKDSVSRAFECPVIMPRPRRDADITLELRNSHHKVIATHTLPFSPGDILVRELKRTSYHVTPVHTGSYAGRKIPVAILPEGFVKGQMKDFHKYAAQAVEAIFAHEPFREMKERFDFFCVDVPSRDADVSFPALGVWRDTAFSSHFSTFLSDRYLTTSNLRDVHDALAGTPYQHIIILANTDTYGGGGIFNSYTLTNVGNPDFKPVVVHEFGHSFGGLADEYFYEEDVFSDTYPPDTEPWEPNITTLRDFHGKWENLLEPGTPVPTPADSASVARYPVGVFEGAGYSFHGVYRPADVCRMRVNEIDRFCPACQQALRRLILFYTED